MNKNTALLAALALVPAALWTSSSFAAYDGAGARQHGGQWSHSGSFAPLANVSRSVSTLSNGVTISETSTDAAAVARLQARDWTKQWSKIPGASVSVANLPNGVAVTVTSPDAATATKIQAVAAHQPGAKAPAKVVKKTAAKKPLAKAKILHGKKVAK